MLEREVAGLRAAHQTGSVGIHEHVRAQVSILQLLVAISCFVQHHRYVLRRVSQHGTGFRHFRSKRQVSDVVTLEQRLRRSAEESGVQIAALAINGCQVLVAFCLILVLGIQQVKGIGQLIVILQVVAVVVPAQIIFQFVTVQNLVRFARIDFSRRFVFVQPAGMLEAVVGVHVCAYRLTYPAQTDFIAYGIIFAVLFIVHIVRPPCIVQGFLCSVLCFNPHAFRGSVAAGLVCADGEARSNLYQFAIGALVLGSGFKIIIGTSPESQGQCQCC